MTKEMLNRISDLEDKVKAIAIVCEMTEDGDEDGRETVVYLCGPIFGKTDSECRDWRNLAKGQLGRVAHIHDPMDNDIRGHENDIRGDMVVLDDKRKIMSSDILLVYPGCEGSWGTAMEVHLAYSLHKYIVGVGSPAHVSPWYRYHCNIMGITLKDARRHVHGQCQKAVKC